MMLAAMAAGLAAIFRAPRVRKTAPTTPATAPSSAKPRWGMAVSFH